MRPRGRNRKGISVGISKGADTMPCLIISVQMEGKPMPRHLGTIPYSSIDPVYKTMPIDLENGERLEITIERKPKP